MATFFVPLITSPHSRHLEYDKKHTPTHISMQSILMSNDILSTSFKMFSHNRWRVWPQWEPYIFIPVSGIVLKFIGTIPSPNFKFLPSSSPIHRCLDMFSFKFSSHINRHVPSHRFPSSCTLLKVTADVSFMQHHPDLCHSLSYFALFASHFQLHYPLSAIPPLFYLTCPTRVPLEHL